MYRPLQFDKRSQYFISTDDETLSVAMRVYDPDHSPFKIESRNPTQAPTDFLEIVGDDFPILQAGGFCPFRASHGNDKVIYRPANDAVCDDYHRSVVLQQRSISAASHV
jgi:hypothetical protein